MKKYDELLKRVETFEKLAVYGNRRAFLKAIAQETPDDAWSRAKLPQVGVPEEEGYIGDIDSEEDRNLVFSAQSGLQQAAHEWQNPAFYPGKATGDHGPATAAALKAFREAPPSRGGLGNPSLSDSDTLVAASKYKARAGGAPVATAIPFRSDVFRAQQRLTHSPYSFQDLEVDGKLGPLTRAYLKSYRQQVGAPANQTDEQSIAALSVEPYNEPAAPLPAPQGVPVTTSPKAPVQEPPF